MAIYADRFWEIDCLRGLAVLLMLFYHYLYDLDFFKLVDVQIRSGFILYAGRFSALLFILISGVALSISHSRALNKESAGNISENFSKYLKRGIKLYLMGLLLTGITWIFLPEEYIVFGILHFFGVSAILVYPFLRYGKENLFFSLFFGLIGLHIKNITFGFSSLLWLGFTPENFSTLDYFPVFPWFGVLLAGVFLGNFLYSGGKRQFELPYTEKNPLIRLFSRTGQHSLLIYFIHQPLFLGLLFLSGLLNLNML
ncbi:hypothetical protein A9239_03275 [Methanosarcina sp. A14]|uniref:Heparan-alpha-glucosaminide N-acetyltransferase catalytic domain-containing protein n=3 Tax=Methanosarcina barkeri TaxID=2208 RepID=A0A0E3LPF0_METBA|nr:MULTISPECIES: heparan-alpha-glucosaminide N-acetyltransferase [Methanosarcina]AKB56406.1 hypothetical protein MSBRM_3408 [Methanosarcina barkeri MS]AKJ40534.1 hypothetical protein MCM1_3551 [Methanosarcina barkeri CM1]OEC91321.1 hypothetical protein A9239_03275 [Methanosarcina sp. A14]